MSADQASVPVPGMEGAAILPDREDNAAIAARDLEPGVSFTIEGRTHRLRHAVPEGHRFAVRPIAAGEPLHSWGMPFGYTVGDVGPGEYLCTERILEVLTQRGVTGERPSAPNFTNRPLDPFQLDEAAFRPGEPLAVYDQPGSFMGYRRTARGDVGTRNHIVVLATSSRVSGYATTLASRLHPDLSTRANIDGVVAVAHTEGGESTSPNNLEYLLRTLSGFATHPNVGAVLIVDDPTAAVTNATLTSYLASQATRDIAVPHSWLSVTGDMEADLNAGAAMVAGWADDVAAVARTPEPLAELKIAMQCGGSDAFSGVTANPLAGAVAAELIRHGGSAVLAETVELMGAEPYVLANVRDAATAQRFLAAMAAFTERVSWHGQSAEGNVSGGNIFRGLYNITIKSIGAGRKRDPAARLEHVIDYAEALPGPGFTFMDSPGNDLESIAGEVATGCNLIYFTTGNGSITNFPFVPTMKFVTTTRRYELLSNEMDVNAGRILDGASLDDLTAATFAQTVEHASGTQTAGELAGHSQVSIWRNWRQTSPDALPDLQHRTEPDGQPLVKAGKMPGAANRTFEALAGRFGPAADQVALVMPTSLCSGQVAAGICEQLNPTYAGGAVTKLVALPHTEGCGSTSGSPHNLYVRTAVGYLRHPSVRAALLLEHGCEMTHNDFFRGQLEAAGAEVSDFGWASIQLDGGIDAVTQRVDDWFRQRLAVAPRLHPEPAAIGALTVGLSAVGPLAGDAAAALAHVAGAVVAGGGTVIVPQRTPLADNATFWDAFGLAWPSPSLGYGTQPSAAGLHLMENPSDDWLETTTGLGAAAEQVMLVHVNGRPVQGHRLVPVVQATCDRSTAEGAGSGLDLSVAGATDAGAQMLDLVIAAASRRHRPVAARYDNVGFQVTRGLLGVSI